MDTGAAATFIAVPAGAVAGIATAVLSQQDELCRDEPTGPAGEPDMRVVTRRGRHQGGHRQRRRGTPVSSGAIPWPARNRKGVDGADPELFLGATWVLTPSEHTSGDAYSEVQSIVRLLGANPVAVEPRRHDELVALVSHTPHLTAAALMNLAADAAASDATLLRLAAGGFRDMTRIAAGHPGIWPDVVADNREAILSTLDRLTGSLDKLRAIVAAGDRDGLLQVLRARPGGAGQPPDRAHRRSNGPPKCGCPCPTVPASSPRSARLLGGLGVNIFDLEIVHSAEGDRGVMVLIVDASAEETVHAALGRPGVPDLHAPARAVRPTEP